MPPGVAKVGRKAIAKRGETNFPAIVVQQLHQLEEDLGGRAHLVGMLTLAPLTPDLRYLLGLLGDPLCASNSLAETCMLANVLPGELLKHLAAAALLQGKVRASQKIGDGIAAVAEDVMRRAAPYEEPCETCRGTGSITPDPTQAVPNPFPGPCATCLGGGKLRYQPELERQKLAIEMAQLIQKGGGIQIAQINASGASGGGLTGGSGALERLQQLTDTILYDTPARPTGPPSDPPVEGELLEDDAS